MSYFILPPKITAEDLHRIRELCPGMGLLEAKQVALKERADLVRKNALDALEELRFGGTPPYSKFDHTVLDLLQYLINKT